jgi:hypothetical protein
VSVKSSVKSRVETIEDHRVVDDERQVGAEQLVEAPAVDDRLRQLATDGRMLAVDQSVSQDRERSAAAVGRIEASLLRDATRQLVDQTTRVDGVGHHARRNSIYFVQVWDCIA